MTDSSEVTMTKLWVERADLTIDAGDYEHTLKMTVFARGAGAQALYRELTRSEIYAYPVPRDDNGLTN